MWKKRLLRRNWPHTCIQYILYVRRSCICCCRHITSVVEPSWFVPVPVLTLEKFWSRFQLRFRLRLRLLFRFRIQTIFGTVFQEQKIGQKTCLFYPRKLTSLFDFFNFFITFYVGSGSGTRAVTVCIRIPVPLPLRQKVTVPAVPVPVLVPQQFI